MNKIYVYNISFHMFTSINPIASDLFNNYIVQVNDSFYRLLEKSFNKVHLSVVLLKNGFKKNEAVL